MQCPLLDLFLIPCKFLKLILGFLARAFLMSDFLLLFEGLGEGKRQKCNQKSGLLSDSYGGLKSHETILPEYSKNIKRILFSHSIISYISVEQFEF